MNERPFRIEDVAGVEYFKASSCKSMAPCRKRLNYSVSDVRVNSSGTRLIGAGQNGQKR